jgi:ribonuclease PH
VQGTAEKKPFSRASFDRLLALAEAGVKELTTLQARALDGAK